MNIAIHSSNDIPSANSPTIVSQTNRIPYDEVPAAVEERESRLMDMTDAEYRVYMNEQMKRGGGSNGSFGAGRLNNNSIHSRGSFGRNNNSITSRSSFGGSQRGVVVDRAVPGEWHHRVIEAEEEPKEGRFSKLRGDKKRDMKDSEKRQLAASKVKINEEKLSKAVPISGRPYDEVPALPPAITEATPDVWYAEHRRQLKEEQLSKEQSRQSELMREKVEKNNSFGFKLKKAFSDIGASLEHTSRSAVKGSENKALEHQEMTAHQRLAKYFPHLEHERYICAFDAEVVHNDAPIAGHIILTDGSLCFVGKGTLKRRLDKGDAADGYDDESVSNYNDSMADSRKWMDNSRTSNAIMSDRTSNYSSGSLKKRDSFFKRHNFLGSKDDGKKVEKEPILITHCLPLTDILSWAPGIVVACKDKHKTYIADIPCDEMIPNALQIFAKDGFVYQFRHFHSRYAAEHSKHTALLTDGHDASYYDRFVNFFDHAWRARGASHQNQIASAVKQ